MCSMHDMHLKVFGLSTNPAATSQKSASFVSTYLCFRLADMLLLKEKLAVQITNINGVQVNLKNHKSKVKTYKSFFFLKKKILCCMIVCCIASF